MVRQRSAKPPSPVQIRLPPYSILLIVYLSCRRGGIGRRAGLKILCPRGRAGSIPAAGIKQDIKRFYNVVVFFLHKKFYIAKAIESV